MPRQLSYAKAINEAQRQAMELSDDVVVLGQLADTPAGIFGTTSGLVDTFGPARVQDFPVAENLMTATALGSALVGLRPVIVHQRLDFMIYSLDAIVNWLALWRFKSNGHSNVPVTIRAIVGRGWGQGPQHSKSLHAWFAHLPGLRVAVPTTPYDAKGLLLESILGESPSIFIEGRSLFSMNGDVPETPYRVKFGQAALRRPGKDVTVVAIGMMAPQAVRAATELAAEGIDAQVIDLRTLSPWDEQTVLDSVSDTRRVLVADPGWQSFGAAGEIVATVAERLHGRLVAPPSRVTLPDSHTPMSSALEQEYYPRDEHMKQAIRAVVQ
jgi:acetoin:2,6-dichlorophenolindophenol oxidoreductase subunit beta